MEKTKNYLFFNEILLEVSDIEIDYLNENWKAWLTDRISGNRKYKNLDSMVYADLMEFRSR